MSREKRILLNPFDTGSGLKKAITETPEAVISIVQESGMKGRGGAGFPTGLKWKFAAMNKTERKFVICNADEGEPGTFKDREMLLNYPEKLFEGMVICAWATGATEGFIYLRAEYDFMRNDLEAKMQEMRDKNLLGTNILGGNFSFDISIKMGAGAYVCGEEFALIESMNGQRGEPRNKPPFPAEKGYLDMPTIVNNVETLSYIPHILANGAEWFAQMGIEGSAGTKLFSVSGDVEKPGVYEFELGITVAELLEEVGGTGAKAVQVGGYSGENVATKDFDKAISFQGLPSGGSTIVFGQDRDMLKVLRNYMEFFTEESCGQCTPCREGNYQLLEAIKRMNTCNCSVRKLKDMFQLCEIMKDSSKCGLGQTSQNAFVSVINNFRDEILFR